MPRTAALSLLLASSGLALASALPAQGVGGQWTKHRHLFGPNADDYLGDAVAPAGDYDGDGFEDLLIGAARFDEAGMTNAGVVFVRSGDDGLLLERYAGEAAFDNFGLSVANAGDVNADGAVDHIVGAPFHDIGIWGQAGKAYVYSGADASLLHVFQGTEQSMLLGWDVAGAGDVNSDGYDDLLVSTLERESGEDEVGSVFVFSGRNGQQLYKFDGDTANERFGNSVASLGDVSGDGVPDYAIGAPNYDVGGFTDAGAVFVYSGADGSLLEQLDGTENAMQFGWDVAGAGDVDADGTPDLVLGTLERVGSPGKLQAGTARVFSGASWQQLFLWQGENPLEKMGWSVDGAGDVDGDGHADIVVGIPGVESNGVAVGATSIFSGASGDLLLRVQGNTNSDDQMGDAVAGVGDTDGDGRDDVAIGAPGAKKNSDDNAGEVRVYALDPFLFTSSTTLSASSGVPVTLDIDFPSTEAGFRYLVLASGSGIGPSSFGGIQLPLAQDPVFSLMIGPNVPALFANNSGTLNFNGDASASVLSDPLLNGFLGNQYHLAVASYDPFTLTGRLVTIARPLTIVN